MIDSTLSVLATEGVEGLSPDHIASDLAVPIGLLIFCGAVFALLWSNYGAKKGGLIYGVAFFGFTAFIGVFWWFGAPGTPVATGLQNFPGQAGDAYQPQWYPFEPGSPRSEFFSVDDSFDRETLGEFQEIEDFVGTTDTSDPMFASISGDLDGVTSLMIEQFFPRRDTGGLDIGASLRTQLQDAVAEIDPTTLPDAQVIADEDGEPQPPSFDGYIAEVPENADGHLEAYLAEEDGLRMAAAEIQVSAQFVNADGSEAGQVALLTQEWFAFKDPGAIWLPSAVWTGLSFLLFGLCLALLDRIEQREKAEEVAVEEAMDVQVPIKQ